MTLNTGQVLNGRYRIVKMLGQGGFGAVYRGWDLNLERPCALKLNLDTSPGAQSQFLREAQMLSNLHHPGLPRVIDHFILPGQGQYLVMDFIQGNDLDNYLETSLGGLPESQVLPWIDQVCEALTYLHSQNPPVIHRDIKPKNIIITPENRAVLVDFGIAKVNQPGQQTTQGARAVTPGFSPPEQYGAGGTNEQSDVYALGATLYSMLTGQVPIESVQRNQALFTPPSMLNSKISAGIEYAILKAMEYAPAARYGSVAEFRSALRGQPAVVYTPTSQVVPQTQQQVQVVKSQRSSIPSWTILIGVLLALACISIAGYLLWQVFVDPQESVQATPRRIDTPVARNEVFNTPAGQPTLAARFTDFPTFVPTLVGVTESVIPTDARILSTLVPTPIAGYPMEIGSDGMVMVYIPPGEFLMGASGSDPEADESEFPQNLIYLDAFWIDQTEVTNEMFARFVEAKKYKTRAEQYGYGFIPQETSRYGKKVPLADWRHPFGPGSSIEGQEDHPVVQVTWDDAREYCAWNGRRLPTEAEWEKAASWDDQNQFKRFYPWGNDPQPGCTLGNYWGKNGGCIGGTSPVGAYPGAASPYGILDMAGNVWEWVWDWYDRYYYQVISTTSSPVNPTGPVEASDPNTLIKALRGGSWSGKADVLRSSNRGSEIKDHPESNIGFRCAADG